MSNKIFLVIVFSFTFGLFAFGQNQHYRDSLIDKLQEGRPGDSLNTLYELSFEYFYDDSKLGLNYVSLAYEIAKRSADTTMMVKSGRVKGQLLRRLDRVEESVETLDYLLPMAYRNRLFSEYLRILNSLALSYTFMAKYDDALKLNFECLSLKKLYGDKADIAITLGNINIIYYKLKHYDKAIAYINQSLRLKREASNEYFIEESLINLSDCYAFKKDYLLAKKYLDKAFLMCKNDCSTAVLISSQFTSGVIYFGCNDLVNAEKHFLRSYTLSLEHDDQRFQLENIVYLAQIYIKLKRYDEAKRYLVKAEEIGSHLSYNLLQIEIYKQFSNLYLNTKDFRNAAVYQHHYIHLRDSVYSETLTQNLMVVQTEYEQQANTNKIEAQNKVLALKEEIIDRQNLLNVLASVAVLLLVVLLIVLYKKNRQKIKINVILDQKVLERSRELKESLLKIYSSYERQRSLMMRSTSEIEMPLSVINNLCAEALGGQCHGKSQIYFGQLKETSNQLMSMVDNLSGKS